MLSRAGAVAVLVVSIACIPERRANALFAFVHMPGSFCVPEEPQTERWSVFTNKSVFRAQTATTVTCPFPSMQSYADSNDHVSGLNARDGWVRYHPGPSTTTSSTFRLCADWNCGPAVTDLPQASYGTLQSVRLDLGAWNLAPGAGQNLHVRGDIESNVFIVNYVVENQ